MRRAIASARELKLSIPDEDLISKAIHELLKARPQVVGRLRLSFSSQRFIATHESYETSESPYSVIVSKGLNSTVGRQHKVFPYTSRLSLLNEAKVLGCDEVIILDSNDRVCEGAVSNYAFRIQDQWMTPPITSGILPGVIRALAIERCEVVVRDLSRSDIASCQSAIALSSLKIASPITSIDGRILAIDSDVRDICSKLRLLASTL